MLSVRGLESFFLLDGWSDVGVYRGVDPSWLEVSSIPLRVSIGFKKMPALRRAKTDGIGAKMTT